MYVAFAQADGRRAQRFLDDICRFYYLVIIGSGYTAATRSFGYVGRHKRQMWFLTRSLGNHEDPTHKSPTWNLGLRRTHGCNMRGSGRALDLPDEAGVR